MPRYTETSKDLYYRGVLEDFQFRRPQQILHLIKIQMLESALKCVFLATAQLNAIQLCKFLKSSAVTLEMLHQSQYN